ncbi:hypothetical protein [Mesorhizobium sp. M1142]|uniref:hypothetical protein n=1 Tax=Mesorhizobium sp. M1142 TaxID=2957060 RepID=UPI00333B6C70
MTEQAFGLSDEQMDILTALAADRLVVTASRHWLERLAVPVPQAVVDLAICDCKRLLHPSAACGPLTRLAIEFLADVMGVLHDEAGPASARQYRHIVSSTIVVVAKRSG